MSISISKISEFISDVKKLRDRNPISMCGLELYSGILMPFVKASTAYLGKQEDSVDMDITYYRSTDPNTPRLYEDVFEEIEQMGFFKYGALPHWGKNRNLTFDGVIKKYSESNEFLSGKNEYDPEGIFSNEWTDGLLGLKDKQVIVLKDGCALRDYVCAQQMHIVLVIEAISVKQEKFILVLVFAEVKKVEKENAYNWNYESRKSEMTD